MLAFTDTEVTKPKLLKSLKAHAKADEIIAGTYWDKSNGRGCAVGCTIHDFRPGAESRHELYEPLFGVPRILARLEDSIFERLPPAEWKAWPLRFAESIREGADLSGVWDRFALWLLIDPDHGVMKCAKRPATRKAIQLVGELYGRQVKGDRPSRQEWKADAYAAAAAAAADYDYADYADYADAAAARKLAAIRQADKLIELIAAC